MQVAVAQLQPHRGVIERNIAAHEVWIRRAAAAGAQLIAFPELSLTGYEPALARRLAMEPHDARLATFQALSDEASISIAVGVPTRHGPNICISQVVFFPDATRVVYSKHFLHDDEREWFAVGESEDCVIHLQERCGLAICYELSVSQHAASAVERGASIYLACVAKTTAGTSAATQRLAQIAQQYSISVLMANAIGPCDGFCSAGRSAVWNRQGCMLAQLDPDVEGLIVWDTTQDEPRVLQASVS